MSAAIARSAALIIGLTLLTGIAAGQDPAVPKKKVPTMSNEDLEQRDWGLVGALPDVATPDATAPVAGKSAAGLPAGWARYSPDECGLSIAFPGKPSSFAIPISPAMGAVRNYVYTDGKVVIMDSHASTPEQIPVGVGAEAFFRGLEVTPAISDMKRSIDPGTGPRRGIKATYLQNGVPLGLEGFVEVHGKNCWFIVAMYQRGNPEAVALAKRALASAKLDRPPCPGQ
jgi:hypothetical protein